MRSWGRCVAWCGLLVGGLVTVAGCGGRATSAPVAARVARQTTWHQADTNTDGKIAIDELTSYIAAWKAGTYDSIDLVTNAIALWKGGESYHHDATASPPFVAGPGSGAPLPAVLQPNVRPLLSAGGASAVVAVDPHTVELSAGQTAPAVGDVVVSDHGGGFMRLVSAVTPNADGSATIATAPAALTDVYRQLELHYEGPISSPAARAHGRPSGSLFNQTVILDVPLYPPGAADTAALSASVKLQGEVDLSATLCFDCVIQDAAVKQLQFSLKVGADAELALNAAGQLKIKLDKRSVDLAKVPLGAIAIPTPWVVPVIINFELVPYLENQLDLTASGAMTLAKLNAGMSGRAGFARDADGTVTALKEAAITTPRLSGFIPDLAAMDPKTFGFDSLLSAALAPNSTLEFELANTTALGFRISARVYDQAGPYVKLVPVEHVSSARLNVAATDLSLVLDDLVQSHPFGGVGVELAPFGHQLQSFEMPADGSWLAYQLHIQPFPITIPFSGAVQVGVH